MTFLNEFFYEYGSKEQCVVRFKFLEPTVLATEKDGHVTEWSYGIGDSVLVLEPCTIPIPANNPPQSVPLADGGRLIINRRQLHVERENLGPVARP